MNVSGMPVWAALLGCACVVVSGLGGIVLFVVEIVQLVLWLVAPAEDGRPKPRRTT